MLKNDVLFIPEGNYIDCKRINQDPNNNYIDGSRMRWDSIPSGYQIQGTTNKYSENFPNNWKINHNPIKTQIKKSIKLTNLANVEISQMNLVKE